MYLRALDLQLLDNVLYRLKFFSLFDKEVRIKTYKLCEYCQTEALGTIIEENAEKT